METHHVGSQLRHLLVVLAPEDLEDRRLGTRLRALQEAGEGAIAEVAHDLHLRVAPRQPLTEERIGVAAVLPGQLHQAVELAAEQDRESGRGLAPLVAQQRHGHGPASVHLTDHVAGLGAGFGEEDLVELTVAGDHADGPHLDTGLVHGAQEEGDPPVLGRGGVGAGEDEDPIGPMAC